MSRAWPPHPQLSAMTRVSLPADGPPPKASSASGDPSSDSDHDHPMQEPEFEIHAVDDDRRARRAPLPPRPLLPMFQRRQLAIDERREANRIERLYYFMFVPQGALCVWTLVIGSAMIFHAMHPDLLPNLTWLIAFSALVMLFSLLSLLLSYLGIYVYDRYPGLNNWLHY